MHCVKQFRHNPRGGKKKKQFTLLHIITEVSNILNTYLPLKTVSGSQE